MCTAGSYRDHLEALNHNIPVRDRLHHAHQALSARLPFIVRVAVVLYDSKAGLLKTYIHSGRDDPLSNYQAPLSTAPSLAAVLTDRRPRVINDMSVFEGGAHEHTRRIAAQGYAASYAMPITWNDVSSGIVIFDSYESGALTESALNELDVFGHLIALMVVNELTAVRTLTAALATTSQITHARDAETGAHIDRVSRYAHLIARSLARPHRLGDDFVEHVLMYAPLHDIGKIAIPDNILLKPGKLDEHEMAIMRTHATRGREMIDHMLANFNWHGLPHVGVLRNIVEYHHEAFDGTGYPEGLKGDEIPLEARIVAAADVLDALTNRRPYKDAWPNDEAFAMLRRLAGEKLDAECVAALLENRAEVENIQAQFKDDDAG
jgi:HD-GYP domain-containing protein (c-di-GMP phosphodiesterase class II)